MPVFLEGGAHALGVIHGERHGLFLVHMLAGRDGRGEVLAVQMLRRSDQDRVDVLVLEHPAMVQVRLGIWRYLLNVLQPARIDIGGADAFHVLTGECLLDDLGTTGAGTDDPEADTLVCAQGIAAGQRSGQTGSDVTDEITTRLHGIGLLGRKPNYITAGGNG